MRRLTSKKINYSQTILDFQVLRVLPQYIIVAIKRILHKKETGAKGKINTFAPVSFLSSLYYLSHRKGLIL